MPKLTEIEDERKKVEDERKRRRKISIDKYRKSLLFKIANAKAGRKYYLKNKEKWKEYKRRQTEKQKEKENNTQSQVEILY